MANRTGFRYGLDPVCLTAIALYVANRFWWKELCSDPTAFVHCYLGDVLCLPVCVPLVLWLQRRLGLRAHDLPPTWREVFANWLVWSCCFEWLGPHLPTLAPGAVADPYDAVAYAGGGALAALLWRSPRGARRAPGRLRRALLSTAFAGLVLVGYQGAVALRALHEWRAAADPTCALTVTGD